MKAALWSGFYTYNEERLEQHQQPIATVTEYLGHGHFLSSLAENWESEFLQMMLFVWLTVFLYQKGSAESKSPPEERSNEEKYFHDKKKLIASSKEKSIQFCGVYMKTLLCFHCLFYLLFPLPLIYMGTS